MSQQTVIRNQAKTQRGKKTKKLVLGKILGVKRLGKNGKNGGKSEKEKNEKELGLVVSQQTVIRNQAVGRPVGRLHGRPDGWPNGRSNGLKIQNLQVKISLSPNFGAERTLIDPVSVTSKFHIS